MSKKTRAPVQTASAPVPNEQLVKVRDNLQKQANGVAIAISNSLMRHLNELEQLRSMLSELSKQIETVDAALKGAQAPVTQEEAPQ